MSTHEDASFADPSEAARSEPRDWPIQHIAALAGTTSRTLRHYGAIGLLTPSRIASNGYRHYDQATLMRLQRILLLRELGLGLPAIASVLASESSATDALRTHVSWLRGEQERLGRLIVSVEKTIYAQQEGATIMAKEMLDGFDHTQHKDEIEQKWGKEAYARSDAWWRGMDSTEKSNWKKLVNSLNSDWIAAWSSGMTASSTVAQELALRHVSWLRSIPGTPVAAPKSDMPGGGLPGEDASGGAGASKPGAGADVSGGGVRDYVLGLADMYVADPRFAANYGGAEGAAFVRDALTSYAEREL